MVRKISLFAAILPFWLGMLPLACTENPTSDPVIDIDGCVARALQTFHVPGAAVGVVYNDKVVLTRGYGYRNKDKQLPVTAKTLFPIGSCTKAFTTFVISQLEEEGKLSWDDPIVKHLPEFATYDDRITPQLTLRDLSCHRSGLSRHDLVWGFSDLSRRDLLQRLRFLSFSAGLREKFQYNNLMYVVLGAVIEKVTGQTWEKAVQERVLSPLGMLETNFSVEELQRCPDFSMPYTERNKKIEESAFRDLTAVGPAGSINSSVEQMVQWLRLHLSNGKKDGMYFLQKRALQELHTTQISIPEYPEDSIFTFGYGLGWGTGMYRGHYAVLHDGGIDGFSSAVIVLPHDHIGVVVLTNSDAHGDCVAHSISMTIIDNLLQGQSEDWITKILTQESLKSENSGCVYSPVEDVLPPEEYVGEYCNPGYGILAISQGEKGLCGRCGRVTFVLQHQQHDSFVAHEFSELLSGSRRHLSFSRSLMGDVVDVRMLLDADCSPIIFYKRPPQELCSEEYLKNFVGIYQGKDDSLEVCSKGSNILANGAALFSVKLIPVYRNVFATEGREGFRLTFEVDDTGKGKSVIVEGPNGNSSLIRQHS